jgi:hypothetical protein
MSAAAPCREPRPGWPELGPEHGHARVPHYLIERIWRVCATPVEVGCCLLIVDQTHGYQHREWARLAKGWFAERLGVSERAVEMALAGAQGRDLVEADRSGTQHNRYRLNLEAFRTGPEYERPGPKAVAERADEDEAPNVQPVEENGILYYGKELRRFDDGHVLVADRGGAATVARCGQCETVAIFGMIARHELEFVEEKAKGTAECSTSRARGSPQAERERPQRSRRPAPSAATVPAGGGDTDSAPKEKIQAVQRYLSTWQGVLGYGPSHKHAASIARALGECPVELFAQRCSRRRGYILRNAQSYGLFKELARECGESFVAEEGQPCPGCQNQRLKPGEVCSYCGPAIGQQAERPADPDWDAVRELLRSRVEPAAFTNWIEPTWGLGSGDRVLRVGADTHWPGAKYEDVIHEALRDVHGDRFERVEVVVSE